MQNVSRAEILCIPKKFFPPIEFDLIEALIDGRKNQSPLALVSAFFREGIYHDSM